ncbi:hypothetical protein DPEC_G00342850 [Dallia pectoralis]|uniref:Uncharacterized protein n=1 Tax=Dallia pectoralis TaxID=75939 RepID=A0ACC2F5R3_DALPE|nr:hypothetical protein DPEC_G00342850 [Dallia pectoralis]
MAVTPGSVSTPASCPPRRISDGVCLGTTCSDTHAVSAGTAGSTFLSSPFPDEDRVEERIDSRVVRQRQHSLKAEGGGALKFPSPLATRKAEESGQSGLMHSLRLHGQSALSEITRPVSGVDRVLTGSTPIAGAPHLSMGDSSPAHHTTSSGFSRAESAGGSSDVTAGLGFHRPPLLLNEVSPSFSSSTVEKSVIANPFRGSLPMGCTSATDGQVSGGESENRLQYFSSKLSPTSRTPALRALLGVASELFPVYVVRSNNKERLYGTVSLRSTPLLGSGGDGDKIRGESDSPAVGNSESQREGRYRHCPTGPEREGVLLSLFPGPKEDRGNEADIGFTHSEQMCSQAALSYAHEMAMSHTSQLVELFTQLGLAVNWKKSAPWPSQKVTYLGLFLDTDIMRARLSDGRTESILSALRLCRPPCRRRVQEIMSLLGLMSAAHAVVTLGLLHMRALQRWFARQRVDPVRHRRRMLIIPYTLAGDLDYWRNPAVLERGVPLGRVSAMTQVFTDASLTGWGGVCQGQAVGGVWPRSQRHINLLELETVQLVLTHFAPRLRGRDVLIRSDNRATVAYINRQGGVRSPVLHEAATRLWLWAHRHLRSLSAVHVPGRQNVGADLMSRGGPRDDDWRLNPEIVSLIWERFGEARADLFAARENAQCRLWFSLRAQDGPPLGTDAFAHHSWPKGLLYAFPPLSCLARLLARVKADHLTVIVVARIFRGRYGIRK